MIPIEKITKIKKKHEKELLKKSGVMGVSVGYKYIDGKKTEELCIVCYVKEKKTEERLNKKDIIPKLIEGIKTDIVQSGDIKVL
ncbi:MAG: hypothetical protein ACFFBP_11465 [Promethearchaeota archaeon]